MIVTKNCTRSIAWSSDGERIITASTDRISIAHGDIMHGKHAVYDLLDGGIQGSVRCVAALDRHNDTSYFAITLEVR